MRIWAELCAVWCGDGVSGVGLLTDSHRSSGPLSVNAHAVTPSHDFGCNYALAIRRHI